MENDSELAAAINAASSSDWATRADAGRQLAARAERSDVAEVLRGLLLDVQDTAVTDATSRALVQRDDVHGARLIAQAVADADAEQHDHLYWTIADPSNRGARFFDLCLALTGDDDPGTRAGAELIVTWIQPDAQRGSPRPGP